MNDHQPPFQTVFETLSRQECVDSSLVLEAVGIAVQTQFENGVWRLQVPTAEAHTALSELDAFQRENVDRVSDRRKSVATYRGSWIAVLGYLIVVLSVAFLQRVGSFGVDWMETGRMHAGSVTSGEWWRCVTALTLHVDAGHVLSNLVLGVLFGVFAGRILGGGVAWLLIIIGGTLGNGVNAMVQASTHSSVGASTAVFAALGILVAHALRPREKVDERLMRRWRPLIAGVVLLGLTGVGGPRTDVMAHVTGFVAGALVGWVGCRLPHGVLRSTSIQMVSGGLAGGLILLAWWRVGLAS